MGVIPGHHTLPPGGVGPILHTEVLFWYAHKGSGTHFSCLHWPPMQTPEISLHANIGHISPGGQGGQSLRSHSEPSGPLQEEGGRDIPPFMDIPDEDTSVLVGFSIVIIVVAFEYVIVAGLSVSDVTFMVPMMSVPLKYAFGFAPNVMDAVPFDIAAGVRIIGSCLPGVNPVIFISCGSYSI